MIEKKDAYYRILLLLKEFLRSEKNLIGKIIFGVLLSNIFLLIVPFFIQYLVGNYLNLNLQSPIILISIIIFGLLLSAYFMVVLNYYFSELICRRIFINNLYRVLNALDKQLNTAISSRQYSRFLELVPVGENIVKLIYELSHTLIVLFFGLIIIVSYHPYYLIYALSLILVLIMLFGLFLADALAYKSHMSDIKYRIVEHLIQRAEEIKNINETPSSTEAYFKRMSKNYLKNSSKYFKIIFFKNCLIALLIPFVQAFFIYISAKLIFDGTLSIGQFVSAELVLTYILASIHKLVTNLDSILSVIVSFDKFHSLIEVKSND